VIDRGRGGSAACQVLALAGLIATGLAISASAAASVTPTGARASQPSGAPVRLPAVSATARGGTSPRSWRADTRPLAGKIIGIDPGHNGRNWTDPAFLDRRVWNGREWEACDTTGTETDGGYTEARFTFNVATYLAADLRRLGARVVMTRHNNHGVGPCVTARARILDRARANVAIDIHADGGPATGRGFTVLEPVADGPNDKVIRSSIRFGRAVHAALLAHTRIPISDYYGHDGYIFRNDLAGLNLTTVPKVLIECGNMRNATDAGLLVLGRVQRNIAKALAAAIVRFLTGR
jgi:N-acetylmuramoyl-L-alanine amidase